MKDISSVACINAIRLIFSIIPALQSLLPLLKQAAQNNSDKPVGVGRAAVINMSSVLGSIAQNDVGGFYAYRCSKVVTE